jgi:spore maturation protein CgeB
MKILYLGDDFTHSTSAHRANALRRLGHDVFHVNPQIPAMRWRAVGAMATRVGTWPVAAFVKRRVFELIRGHIFDLAWIDGGAALSPSVHRLLKSRGLKMISYNVDDPFGPRDGRKWDLYRRSVRLHDITVVVRKENVAEAMAAGARRVIRVFRSYDPVAHRPIVTTPEVNREWGSEVAFVGTWMPERGPFLARLLELGVPLSIRGNRWERASEWETLSAAWRGPAVYGDQYVAATQCSRVSLGLLSKGNRDLHTQRSAEIPAIGETVFCAERTTEHQQMMCEGKEAEFFESPDECARKCMSLLGQANRRGEMARLARERIARLHLSNDEVIQSILYADDATIAIAQPGWGCKVTENGG